jgi:hypothetical protein
MARNIKIEAYEALRKAPYIRKGPNVKYCELERKVAAILEEGVAPELPKYDIYETNGEWYRVFINRNTGRVHFTEAFNG